MESFTSLFVMDHGLTFHRAADAPAVEERLSDALATGVFGVASLAGIHALVAKSNKITIRAVKAAEDQMARPKAAASQKGGNPTGFPSDYYGVPHASYSPAHIHGGVDVSTVNFAAGIARPEQGGGAAGAAHDRNAVAAIRPEILKVVQHHDLTISQNALRDLAALAHAQMDLLAADLRAAGPLTVKKVDRVLAMPRHKRFAA